MPSPITWTRRESEDAHRRLRPQHHPPRGQSPRLPEARGTGSRRGGRGHPGRRDAAGRGSIVVVLSRLDPAEPQDAEARRHPHPGLRLGPARPRSPPDEFRRPLPDRVPRRQPPRPLPVHRRGAEYRRPHAQGRPRGILVGQHRPARVDLQAAPGRQVAQRGAAQRPRAGRRGHQVLLRAVRQGRRAGVHVPGDRGDGDARQAHGARPSQDVRT